MSHHALATLAVLASAGLHAGWNAMVKGSSQTRSTGVMVLCAAGVLGLLCTLLVRQPLFPDPRAIYWSLLAGVFEAGYFLSLVWCLFLGPLTQVYSFSRGGSLLIAWPISVGLMGEPLVGPHLAGAAVVLLGLVLCGLDRSEEGEAPRSSAYLAALSLCAGCIAAFHLLYKQAMSLEGNAVAVFALSMLVAVPVNLFWHRKLLRSEWSELQWRVILPAAILCVLSFQLALLGLKLAGTGWVLTLRNTSVVMALLLAWRMGESIPRARALGTLLIAAGALILSRPH